MVILSDILLARGTWGASIQETFAPLLGSKRPVLSVTNLLPCFWDFLKQENAVQNMHVFKSQVQEYRASSVPLDLNGGPLLGLSCLRPVLPGEKLHFLRLKPQVGSQDQWFLTGRVQPLLWGWPFNFLQFIKSWYSIFCLIGWSQNQLYLGNWQVGRVWPVTL